MGRREIRGTKPNIWPPTCRLPIRSSSALASPVFDAFDAEVCCSIALPEGALRTGA
jgi:hypothetical protein